MSLLTVDGCRYYAALSEADRAQGYKWFDIRSDQSLVTGWYRFQGAAGDQMAGKCVPELRCGTYAPGWLSGAHPTVAEGVVTRRVCFSAARTCCHRHHDIRIKNCGAYFVYELPGLHYGYMYGYMYDSRYCGNGSAGRFLQDVFNRFSRQADYQDTIRI